MDPGDVFFLASDGFYEWADPDEEEFGTGRVFDVIEANPEASATEIIEYVRAAVKDFARGTRQEDDLTAVVLIRR
jgi:sigma-B regulation protein RsbU (phosphoserine phosphatase)